MGGAGRRRQGNRSQVPITLQAEVVVVDEPGLRRRQLKAIREFLLSLAARVGERVTAYTAVGVGATDDGLEGLMGPIEAAVVRVVWAAKALGRFGRCCGS